MNAIGISMVKNEADIVEAFVRHNLAFLDLLVVIDNASTDGTRAILQALQAEGLPLLIFDDPIFAYYQSEKMSHVYRKVVPIFQPDLVYLLDADEFLHASSRGALEAALQQIAPGDIALLPWSTHVPNAHTTPELALTDPLGAMPARRRREEPVYYKAVIRRRAADDPHMVIEQGNHMVHYRGGRRPQAAALQGVSLVHLPVRSVEQLSAKVINGWHAYMVKNRHQAVATMGFQWQQLYELIVDGPGLNAQDLTQTALDYAQQSRPGRSAVLDVVDDPVPARYGELRHLALGRHNVLAKVARNLACYLANDSACAAQAGSEARDLAPLLALLTEQGTRSIAALAEVQGWLMDLQACRPGLINAHGEVADLLLLPVTSHSAWGAIAQEASSLVRRCVVVWCPRNGQPEALRQALTDWWDAGWAPDLLPTLGYRARSSYRSQRETALVLRPRDKHQEPKALAVREALCAMESQPSHWQDPKPQTFIHPLQDMDLQAA